MRNAVRALAVASLLLGPTALAFFSGGFFERPRLIAGIVAWAIAAVAVVVSPRPLPRSGPALTAIAGLALLTGWTALSYEWAPLGGRAQDDIQRLLLYLGFFVACVALLRGRIGHRAAEPGLALGAFVATAYGLSARLVPDLVTLERSSSAEGRLEAPLTYWNAMGCLSAIGLVLCVRLAADARRSRVLRMGAALCGPALGLGVYLSFSRGAIFALVMGLTLLLVLSPALRDQLRAMATLVAAAALASLVAALLPAVESLPPGAPGDAGQGALMLVTLMLLSAGAAVATGLAPVAADDAPARRLTRRPAIAAAFVVLVIGGLTAAAALESNPAARSAGSPTSPTRFTSADSTRYAFWGVALDAFAESPLAGTGSGGFAVEWRRQPDRTERAVDAHSLYVETLSELGIVGAALLMLFLGGILASTMRLWRHAPAAAAGPAAAFFVWAVHAGLDWDWEMPALTGVALGLAAALVAWDDDTGSTSGRPPPDRARAQRTRAGA